jgi:hypothetical protein
LQLLKHKIENLINSMKDNPYNCKMIPNQFIIDRAGIMQFDFGSIGNEHEPNELRLGVKKPRLDIAEIIAQVLDICHEGNCIEKIPAKTN